jgi:hypothetical protein
MFFLIAELFLFFAEKIYKIAYNTFYFIKIDDNNDDNYLYF